MESQGGPQRDLVAGGLRPLSPAARNRVQQVFEHARKSIEKGDFDYAHDLLTQCVSEDPQSVLYVQHLRANLQRKHGDKRKSGPFGLNLRLGGGAKATVARHMQKGDWTAAFKAGCDSLKSNPHDVPLLLELAEASGSLSARDTQLFYLRWALDTEPKHEHANRQAADAFAAAGLFDQAIACLRRVQEARPQDFELANKISRFGVEQTIQKGGFNPDLLKGNHGDVSIPIASRDAHAKNVDSAVEPADREAALRQAIDQDPALGAGYIELASFLTAAGKHHDAEQVLRQGHQATGGGDLAIVEHLEETRLRRIGHQVEVAQRRAAAEKTPESRELAHRLAGEAQQAEIEVYAARAERQPGNPLLQFELGMRLKRAGKFREAIGALQLARSDNRHLAETQLALGECFQHIEQYRLAMTSYEAAVAALSDASSELAKLARYRAGVLATGLKEFDRAEKHLTNLAEVDFAYRDVADRLDKLAQLGNT